MGNGIVEESFVRYSYLVDLVCPRCGRAFDADIPQGTCTCGSPLTARYDLDSLRRDAPRPVVDRADLSLWRYHSLLPLRDPRHVITLGEGMTPLLPVPAIGALLGVPRLMVKDEGVLPTGSFKARGAAVGVSRAVELGVSGIAMPTNGNAGAAWALFAARAGLRALIAMPVKAPHICRGEIVTAGAELYLVEGHIGDCGRLISRSVAERPGMQEVSTLREPYRLEGKKTMALEIVEQLGWSMPDVIVYPTGGGVGIIGIHKALNELMELGWLVGRIPRLIAVQSTGCAPIVRAYERRQTDSEPWADPHTVAFGINVPKALGDFLVLEAIYATDGCAIAVSDEEILDMQAETATREGLLMCPEGAATIAAVARLRESGAIAESELVVALNTGAGLKYPETLRSEAVTLRPDELLPSKRVGWTAGADVASG